MKERREEEKKEGRKEGIKEEKANLFLKMENCEKNTIPLKTH